MVLTNTQLANMSGIQKVDYIHQLKVDAAKTSRFKSRCRRCKEKIRTKDYMRRRHMINRGFTFHHIFYHNGQKTHKDFQAIPGKVTKIDSDVRYQEEVVRQVKAEKTQFWFFCMTHHQGIERFIKYNEYNLRGMTRDAIYCRKMQALENSKRHMA